MQKIKHRFIRIVGMLYIYGMQSSQVKVQQPARKNICNTCGTRYGGDVPETCSICADERQYIPVSGQSWMSYDELKQSRSIRCAQLLDNVYDLRINPSFAIGQKAHLILSDQGNILWDCLPFLDEQTVAFIRSKGGVNGIAISHPHYYSLMSVWADTFDCPVYLHQADSEWVMDHHKHISLWEGNRLPLPGNMQLIHTGGHFNGSTVLHAPDTGPSGSLFVGDTLQVSLSRQFISMMYSYPNIIPLPLKTILYIHQQVTELNFDAMYGAFEWQVCSSGAKDLFERSVKRYIEVYNQETIS
jgi:hypothetical protein